MRDFKEGFNSLFRWRASRHGDKTRCKTVAFAAFLAFSFFEAIHLAHGGWVGGDFSVDTPSPSVAHLARFPAFLPSGGLSALRPIGSSLLGRRVSRLSSGEAPCGRRAVPRNQAICRDEGRGGEWGEGLGGEGGNNDCKHQADKNKHSNFGGRPVVTSRPGRQTACPTWRPGTIWAHSVCIYAGVCVYVCVCCNRPLFGVKPSTAINLRRAPGRRAAEDL